MFADLIYTKSSTDHVASIVINRPATLNAMTGYTMNELVKAFEDAARDDNVGVVLLSGAGSNFSSGGDLNWERETLKEGSFDVSSMVLVDAMRHCLKPVIAVVRGYAVGGGNWLAAFCDLTLASSDAIFGQNGPRVGSPAEGLQVSHLAHLVGEKKAREMWMLCRRYSAAEALEMGLVNAVAEPDDLETLVEQWCSEITKLSPSVLRIVKASFESNLDVFRDSTIDHWRRLVAPAFLTSGESREGQDAFLEKRTPDFWRFLEESRS